jgi:hypothetical protein
MDFVAALRRIRRVQKSRDSPAFFNFSELFLPVKHAVFEVLQAFMKIDISFSRGLQGFFKRFFPLGVLAFPLTREDDFCSTDFKKSTFFVCPLSLIRHSEGKL